MQHEAPNQNQSDQLSRREALARLGGVVGAVTLAGCGLDPTTIPTDGSSTDTTGGSNPSCIATPAQTEGPYFVDELLNRSDIRSDPNTGVVQTGLPLRLRINVSQIVNGACAPLAGAIVDVWHCNAQGQYSDVAANNTVGKKFLRGYQTTDANGAVEFSTIYPGWYQGRAVHIHFKIRLGALEFTSQLYFDPAVTAQVYTQSPYSARGQATTTNASDNIYNSQTLLTLTPDGSGYLGTFDVGLRLS